MGGGNCDNYIYIWNIQPFSYYFLFSETLNMSNEKSKSLPFQKFIRISFPLYQPLLVFNVVFPPEGTNLTPVLILLLFHFLPVLLPIIRNLEILFPL